MLAVGIAVASADPLLPQAKLRRRLLEQVECEVTPGREVFGPIPASDLTVVVAERHIQYPMAAVLHLPVCAHRAGNRLGCSRQRGNEITPLHTDLSSDMSLAFDHRDALESPPMVAMRPALQVPTRPTAAHFDAIVPSVGLRVIRGRHPRKSCARQVKKSTMCSRRRAWFLHCQCVIATLLHNWCRNAVLATDRINRDNGALQLQITQ